MTPAQVVEDRSLAAETKATALETMLAELAASSTFVPAVSQHASAELQRRILEAEGVLAGALLLARQEAAAARREAEETMAALVALDACEGRAA